MTNRRRRSRPLGFAALAAAAAFAGDAEAQERRTSEPRWGAFLSLAGGTLAGDFASALERPVTGEFGVVRDRGPWRWGVGVSFGSKAMPEPFSDELEWGHQRLFLSAARGFLAEARAQPYLEGRLGVARLHPRSELFALDPLPEGFEIGDSPTPASNGLYVGLLPGLRWAASSGLAFDASLALGTSFLSDTDLTAVDQGSASTLHDAQLRLGLTWWMHGSDEGGPPERDAWGIRPSWGWAVAEALAINFGASAFNEYVRNANFNQISPRSWWANLEEGPTYDDNTFFTNQFNHPFNGSQYFNAGRTHGIGFWSSYAVALLGAVHWEVAGETHPLSLNDVISTGVGGAAVGEAQYRFSSMVLNNRATGIDRVAREAVSFVVDPVRGLNRLVTGRMWKDAPNPVDPADSNPTGQINALNVGWRRVGQRQSLRNDVDDYAFIEYRHRHGDVFTAERRGAFDYFTFEGQLNIGDKSAFGRLVIDGNLWATPLEGEGSPRHVLAAVQRFQYLNNAAYEFGGQSLGGALMSRWGSLGEWTLESRFAVMGTLLGAVNSEGAELAEVADPERIREYDYGPGLGGGASVELFWRGHPILWSRYSLDYLEVVNGSIFHDEEVGLDSSHWLHGVDARLEAPPVKGIGFGLRYTGFTRDSDYGITTPELEAEGITVTRRIEQFQPEVRVYLSWVPSRPW